MKKLRTYIIYLATNKVNGKIYIGQTFTTLNARVCKHFSDARLGIRQDYFHRAIAKHGQDNFVFKEIDRCFTEKCADALEIHYIAYYKARNRVIGYNLAKGGRTNRGFRWTEEQKQKITGENNHFFGKKHLEKTKLKVSKSKKGTINSEEFCRKVICIETGIIYRSVIEAAKLNNIPKSNLTATLQKRRKTCNGYHWEYLNEDFDLNIAKENIKDEKIKIVAQPIVCIETNQIYNSINQASRELGIRCASIHEFLKGNRQDCKGKTFKRLDNN